VIISLITGALATTASAWFAAAFLDVHDGKLHALEHEQPPVSIPAYIGAPQDWHLRTWHGLRGPAIRYDLVSECEWAGSKLGSSPATAPNRTLQRITTGWPLPAMQYDSIPSASAWVRGIPILGSSTIAGGLMPRRLPLRPLPIPFLLDTAAFALAGWAAIFAAAKLRATSRRRRGLCIQCAYPVAGLATCPECGIANHPQPRSPKAQPT
jgi:hypothetical protein